MNNRRKIIVALGARVLTIPPTSFAQQQTTKLPQRADKAIQ
jgi:phosphoenolpyruvate synthase/pyruvate phosphate dikinase